MGPYAANPAKEAGDKRKTRQGVEKNRMKRMLDGAKVLRGIRKEGVSPEAFLVHVVASSPELIDLKSKGFGKFSVNPASSGLFWRFGAGCAIAHKTKEKPSETNWFPTV